MNQQIVFRPNPDYFVVGGAIRDSAASYVERAADRELLESLRKGESCYILTTRQMGKTSLVVRTAVKLKNLNISSAIIDLTFIGKNIEPEAWYLGQISRIQNQLCPHIDYLAWWEANTNLSEVQRYVTFLSQILLTEVSNPVILFVDEIDSVLETFYGDDYFAALRSIYNQRASDSRLQRLNFVLLGTATLSDLIKDVDRTPFNVGKRIDLNDFTLEEALPLAVGLAPEPELANEMLKQIMAWTDGHPYLTQKVCSEVALWARTSWDSSRALSISDEIVRDIFLSKGGQDSDGHIQGVRDRLIKVPQSDQLIKLYQRVWQGENLPDDARNPIYSALKLSGIVKTNSDGLLEIRNKVYYHVFDLTWINSILVHDSSELIQESSTEAARIRKRRPIAALALALFILMTILAFLYLQKDSPSSSRLVEVSIFTQPDAATVFLNGDSLGVTPLKFSSRDSTRIKLRLQKRDYFLLDTAFVIRKGRDSTLSFALQPAARVSIEINPIEAKVVLDEKAFLSSRLKDITLHVGEHNINISAEGYVSLAEQFSLVQGRNPVLNYRLNKKENPPLPQSNLGNISFSSDPSSAGIFVGGDSVGVTPMTIQKEEGKYQIVLRKSGYKDYPTSVTVESGRVASVDAQLTALVGTLSILVNPFGSIYIDGQLQKVDADRRLNFDLAAGTHRLRVEHPSYGVGEKTITIKLNEELDVFIDFNKMVMLTVTSAPVLGEIFIDGNSKGYAPKQLTLHVGQHTIEVRREGYAEADTIINLENDWQQPLKLILRKIP